MVKVKAKFFLEKATKAQRGSLGTRCGWVVNAMPQAALPVGKDPVPVV
jgi:hypothetical protein